MKTPLRTPLAAAALLVVLTFAACSTRPVTPHLSLERLDTLLKRDSTTCQILYRFVSIDNADASSVLAAIERANIGYFFDLEEFSGSVHDAMSLSLHEIENNCLPPFSIPQHYEVAVEAEATVVDTLLTYVITRSSYLGGAHGMYGTECHNYTLTEGYEVTTADLDPYGRLDSLIRQRLYSQYGVADDAGLESLGFFPQYIAATENFLITPEGVTFHYNPYDIGCYALGAVEVRFSHDEIRPLLAAPREE